MRAALLALGVLAGCDRLFGLSTIAPRIDAPNADAAAPIDGFVCGAGVHDEDGDGLSDDCDPCPAEGGGGDADGDGVGDLCDPNPTVTGDTRVFFDGFATQDPAWTASGGWSFGQDVLQLVTMPPTALVTHPIPPTRSPTIDGYFRGVTDATTAGVGVNLRLTDMTLASCPASIGNGKLAIFIMGMLAAMTPWPPGTGDIHIVLTRLPDGRFRCRAARGNNVPVEITSSPFEVGVDAIEIGLGANDSTVIAPSVTVFASP